MKKLLGILLFSMLTILTYGQGKGEFWVRHWVKPKCYTSHKAQFKTKNAIQVIEKGTVVEKKIDGKTYMVTLKENDTIRYKDFEFPDTLYNWRSAGEVKFTDDEPSKLYLNPLTFTEKKKYNTEAFIEIPRNQKIILLKTFAKISPLTIPFAIRLGLNDSIKSQASTDLNLGVGFSYNINWDNYKNKVLKAVHSSYGISFGVGVGFSKISLTPGNTSLSGTPLKDDQNGLAFTFAPGIGVNLQSLSFVGFYAIDLPITSNVHRWNYYNKGYFGIGMGVDLSVFGALAN